MNAQAPEFYSRRILIAVAGLSPQIITETIYALAMRRPAFVPTEVRVLTTTEGAERIRLQLLSEDPGWFQRLRREYELPPIAFGMKHVRVVERSDRPLADIHTDADNAAVADAACRLIRGMCEDEGAAVHVSIAGGRKTMGYYLGYALSLFGRSQDRLSHVLVEPPFESHPDFFYPTCRKRVIYTHTPDQKPLDTSEARVMLAEIPFVRLRDGMPKVLLAGNASFSATVKLAQESLGPARLILDEARGWLSCNARQLRMQPAYFAFYAAVTRLWREGKTPGRHELPVEAFFATYRRLVGEMDGNFERVEESLRGEEILPANRFDEYRSKANQCLQDALGPLARLFAIAGKRGERGFNRYGPWGLSPENVRFAKLGGPEHAVLSRQSSGEETSCP